MTYPPSGSDERVRERFPAKCFWCHRPGHIQRDCPHRNHSASSSQLPPVTHDYARAEARGERPNHKNYRDRSTGDLRIQSLRNKTASTRETKSSLHENRRQDPPIASRKASRRRSRSPARDHRSPNGIGPRDNSDIRMGGMTNSFAAKGSSRSRKNSLQPSQKETAQYWKVDYPGVNNDFGDPYLASESTPEGRDTLRRAEYFPAPSGSEEAETEAVTERALLLLASRDLTPAEIPGRFIRSCTPEQQQYLCQNLNAISAHASAAVHHQKYGNFDRTSTIAENTTTPIGAFGLGPIMENMCDLAIGVQDTDRVNSTHGPVIGDRRPLILMNNEGGTLQVASITSFGGADGNGRGAPPRGKEKEYALLVDELASDPKPSPAVRILSCSGAMLKPKGSWVRLSRFHELPEWAPIEWSRGRISIDAHTVLADAFNFASGHILREIGESRRIRKAKELRKVGGDAAEREERGKKQQREMKEIREREERLKAQKNGSREQSEHPGVVDMATTSSSKINERQTHQQRWPYSQNQEQQHVPIPPESSGVPNPTE